MERPIWIAGMIVAGAACGGGGGGGRVAAPAPKPLVVTPMSGPYADVAAYCVAAVDEYNARYDDEDDAECWPVDDQFEHDERMPGAVLPTEPTPLTPPFRAARFVAVGLMGPTCTIAVETDRGWYGAGLGSACGDQDSRTSSHLELVELTVKDLLPGGAPELLIRLRELETYSNMDNDGLHTEVDSEVQVVCGLGASGRPHCVEPLIVRHRSSTTPLEGVEPDPEMAEAAGSGPPAEAWVRTVEYRADAMVVTGGPPERTGRHAVAFP